MKLVIVSDTHNKLQTLQIPKGEILIHCGDLTMGGTQKECETELAVLWKLKSRFQRIILVAGNHDWLAQNRPSLFRELCTKNGVDYLCDEAVVMGGLKFYGSPHQPRYFDWAFNLNRGRDIREKWDLIPVDTDVLVTHGPPFGVLDYSEYGKMRAGCEDLLEVVQRIKPAIHCFGHLHASYGMVERGGTTFLNAAVLNDRYDVARQPWVVNIDTVTKKVEVESPWRERG